MYIVNASRAASKTSIQRLILQRHLRLISLHALILLIIAASIIPLYGAIGLFSPTCDVVQDGVYESQQRYSCSLYISVSSMALFRATHGFYTQIIPSGEEARWCGLFLITDKVCVFPSARQIEPYTNWGSATVFVFLVFMLWAALLVLPEVNMGRQR